MAGDLKPGTDCKLTRMAIRKGWKIPNDVKETLPEKLMAIIDNEYVVERDKIAAAKTLVAMEGQNQADDHLIHKDERIDSGQSTEATAMTIKVVYEESECPKLP